MPIVKKVISEQVETDERKHARDCGSLAIQLFDPNPTARRWAARDLLACPDASETLAARLTLEYDSSVREIILTTLTRLGDDIAVKALVDCLRSEDVALRNEAIEAMKHLPDEVAPIMQALLADLDSDVRIFAVNILESLRHPQVEEWLIDVIEREPHLNVCGAAVDLLGETGTPRSLNALASLKKRFPDEPYIQFAANLAIKHIGGV